MEEPKVETVATEDFNSKADAFLDAAEKAAPAESSPAEKAATEEPLAKEPAGADQLKKAEGSEAKEDAGKDPRDLAFRKGYNEAKAKFEKTLGDFKPEDVEKFKKVTSSPEYIRASMKAQGYTDEAIDRELLRLGHQVAAKPNDDVALVTSQLGLDPNSIDANTRAVIADIAKITDVIFKDRVAKLLPGTIKPLEDTVQSIAQANNASKLMSSMKEMVAKEDVLDFAKDIEPELHRFIDGNEGATQEDIFNFFKDTNSRLTIERLKTGKKAVERSEKKEINRPLSKGEALSGLKLPKKSGNFNEDADALLDTLGVS